MRKVYWHLYYVFGSEKLFRLTWCFSGLHSPYPIIKWALSFTKNLWFFCRTVEEMDLLDLFKKEIRLGEYQGNWIYWSKLLFIDVCPNVKIPLYFCMHKWNWNVMIGLGPKQILNKLTWLAVYCLVPLFCSLHKVSFLDVWEGFKK